MNVRERNLNIWLRVCGDTYESILETNPLVEKATQTYVSNPYGRKGEYLSDIHILLKNGKRLILSDDTMGVHDMDNEVNKYA